jgi:predicted phosphate transport protein (TIGR00153 family)
VHGLPADLVRRRTIECGVPRANLRSATVLRPPFDLVAHSGVGIVRLPFIPREEKFFDMFIEDAANVLVAARMLEQFFANYGDREQLAIQLRDLEHRGDEMSHSIGQKLESTFVTPIDREDISLLISRLDDIVDLIEEVADTCILYGIEAPTPVAVQQAGIITRQCEQLQEAIINLRQFKDLAPYWIEIHRLENEGDKIVRRAIAELFKNGQDPVDVIKWKDLYALLEEAIDSCEDAANVVERIVVKHA